MPLSPGAHVGSYEILTKLGEGGMGEVYRARDPKLNRDVAIKSLPALFASDPDRIRRFEREAQTLASLNHPNIAQIYGVTESPPALVMELVEGEDLAQRLARGAIPSDEALTIARQAAEALEAAHDQGIIHRDLKPANIKVRPDGVVKVLDFGLAKALAGDLTAGGGTLANSPTLTSPAMTAMGVILGTAAYMAPEQARGKPVDRRADVWAFGCVLYEMLTGRATFPGETATDTISGIVAREPDWNALPAATPASVRRLLRRCLEKDPRQRLQAIGEARIALGGQADEPVSGSAPVSVKGRGRLLLPLSMVAALAGGAAAAWLFMRPTAPPPQAIVPHLEVSLAPADRLEGRFALSPDGRMLSFVGVQGGVRKLYVRHLDGDEAVPLAVAEVSDASEPRFSPDGKWIAFDGFGVLEKVAVDGGAAMTLARAGSSTVTGIAWGPDDTIVFSNPSLGLSKVSASGGDPKLFAMPDAKAGEISLEMPLILPGGTTVLYDVRRAAGSVNTGVTTIVAQPLAGGPRRELFPGMAVGLIGGNQLVIAREDGIFVMPFDTERVTATGPAKPLIQPGAGWQEHIFTSAPLVSVSRNGTIAYQPAIAGANDSPMMIVDRSGSATTIDLPPHRYADPRVSPEGSRVVVHTFEEGRDNWVVDLRRGTLTRLTFDPGEDETPVWSPDGRWVYWSATRAEVVRGIYRRPADGSGSEELLWTGIVHTHLGGLTPDGETMIVGFVDGPHRLISALHLSDKKMTPLVATPFTNIDPALSPDGKWLAYTSDETGREEVYVQPYPSMAARTQVSVSGGTEPVWSRRDRQLFYRAAGKLMTVDFAPGDRFTASPPRVVIADPYDNTQGSAHTGWDTMPDGRFVFVSKPKFMDAPITHLKLLYRP